MVRKKSGASSTSYRKVSNDVGTPNVSAKEIKAKYETAQKEKYAKAMESIKRLRDPNKSSTKSMNSYTRETIRGYLQAPASNESNLRNVSKYLYFRSHIYYRLIQWYAGMWRLDCRQVIPPYNLIKEPVNDSILKYYNDTLDYLDIYNIQGNWVDVATRCYTEDVCYSIFFRDETGSFFYIVDPSYCVITGKYFTGDFSFAIDMSKYRSSTGQQLIEWLGEPFKSMSAEYERTHSKYIEVPDEYAACFKFRSSDWDLITPPFATLFQELAGLMDQADYQAIADKQSIYKLVTLPMKILNGAKLADDFEVSPDLALEYFERLIDEALPDYVSAAMIPGDGLDVIDFSDSNADKDVDRYETSQNTILETSGGGAILSTKNITSTAAFKAWLKAETELAISTLLPQVEGFTNRMLKKDLGDNACTVKYFEVSVYTIEELTEKLLESCQYSFSNRLAYNTCLGISEKATIAMNYLEENILKLHEKMVYPLNSSYTQSSDETGRPTVDDDEISDSGERSRNQ